MSAPAATAAQTDAPPTWHAQNLGQAVAYMLLFALIGIAAGIIAFVLYNLIGLFTNLFFYQRLSFQPITPDLNQLGLVVILIPVIGGLIVGMMARYGTPKIRGHGIPEAMEAVLTNRSRIAPRRLLLLHDMTDQKKAQAQLLEQQRALAILTERERLARELHDDLAQVLAFISMQGQVVQQLLVEGEVSTAGAYAARLVEAADEAAKRPLRRKIT